MELDSLGVERMLRVLRHRLLNIVSGAKSAISLLASELDDRLTAREREYFPLIQKECDQICGIVDRMDALFGVFPPPLPVPLQDAVSATLVELRHNLPMAEIHLEIKVKDSRRLVCMSTLLTVLSEAIENAYAISKKPVHVCIGDSEDSCAVRIIDQGQPLSKEVCELAFEPFYTGRTRHLGLGLPIAKRAVERLGGTVSIGTEASGNVVGFILPYL